MSEFANIEAEMRYVRRVKGIATRFCEVGIKHCKAGRNGGSARRHLLGTEMAYSCEPSAMHHAKGDCAAFDLALAGSEAGGE